MNYPDRTAIDNAEEQLENGNYDPTKSLIQDRTKAIIKVISDSVSTV